MEVSARTFVSLFLAIAVRKALEEAGSRRIWGQTWVVISASITSLAARVRAVRVRGRRRAASAGDCRVAMSAVIKTVKVAHHLWIKIAVRTANTVPQTKWVNENDRVVRHVIVKIGALGKTVGVLADESSGAEVVIALSVVVDAGLGIELPARVLERVRQRAARSGQLAKRIVGVTIRDSARWTAE